MMLSLPVSKLWLASLLAVLLATVSHPVDALYADEAGLYEWHQPYIGQVSSATYLPSSTSLLTTTSSGIVASLQPSTAELDWRALPANSAEVGIKGLYTTAKSTTKERQLYVVLSTTPTSSSTPIVRAYNPHSGGVVWEHGSVQGSSQTVVDQQLQSEAGSVSSGNSARKHAGDLYILNDNTVVAVTGSSVVAVNAYNGELQWQHELDSSHQGLHLLHGTDNQLYVVLVTQNHQLAVVQIDPTTGKKLQGSYSVQLPAAGAVDSYVTVLEHKTLLVATTQAVQVFSASSSKPAFNSVSLTTVTERADVLRVEALQHSSDIVAVYTASKVCVVQIKAAESSAPTLHVLQSLPVAGTTVAGVSATAYAHAALTQHDDQATLDVTVYQNNQPIKLAEHVELRTPATRVTKVYAQTTATTPIIRDDFLVVVTDDGTIYSIQYNAIQHVRFEALSSIQKHVITTLPVDTGLLAGSDSTELQHFPSLMRRIPVQLYGIYNMLISLVQTIVQSVNQLIQQQSTSASRYNVPSLYHSDDYGFSQVLVAATANNQIYALNTATGDVLWVKSVDSGLKVKELVVGSQHTVHALLQSTGSSSELRTFHLSTGKTTTTRSLPTSDIIHTIHLPLSDVTEQSHELFLLVDGSLQVHTLNAQAQKLAVQYVADLHSYVTHLHNNSVSGYSLHTDSKSNSIHAVLLWSFTAPAGEVIASVTTRTHNDVIRSGVRHIQSADQLLYRYTDNNILVIATYRAQPSSTQTLLPIVKRSIEPSVSVHIVQTLTGAVLEKLVYKQCSSPVHLAITENTIVLHLYDHTVQSYVLSVIELYVPHADTKLSAGLVAQGLWDALLPSAVSEGDAAQSSQAYALQQSYIFNTPITAMQWSATARGITSRELIVALASNQLYSIPKPFLDPKRPMTPPTTDLEKADQLVPYAPSIDIDPKRIISSTHQIANLRAIDTVPTTLESTTLVIAYGLDLFATRLTPSQPFDLLNSDFNYPFLIATVGGLLGGIAVTRQMARRKELDAAWK